MNVKTIAIILFLPLALRASYFDEYYEYLGHVLMAYSNSFQGPVISEPENDYDIEVYDFVIIGAGTAGCVLANRLSEIEHWKILLLEAGTPENPVGKIPAVSQMLQTTRYNWGYQTVPQRNSCLGMIDNVCNQASGKSLGGGSAIGDNIYTVGNRYDYDEWEAGGNPGWGYHDVLPYFKKAEYVRLRHYDEGYHGEHGPISVELQRNPSLTRRPFLRAVQELNYTILDYNGKNQIGFGDTQVTTLRGWRNSVSSAYLVPMHERLNLVVKTSSFVERILIDNKEAYGVMYMRNGRRLVAKARREVLVSAGTFNSPKILQLSGIGPEDLLKDLGIKVISDLPVGRNLRDHVTFLGLHFTYEKWHPEIDYLYSFQEWFFHGEGPLTSSGIDVLGYLNSNIEVSLSPIPLNQGYRIVKPITNFKKETYDSFWQNTEGKDSFSILVTLVRARSVGTVRVKSNDPHDDPLIDPRYLEDPQDVETLLFGIRRALEITNTTSFGILNATLNTRQVDGCDNFQFSTDNYWRCAIRRLHVSSHDPTGTNKMGPKSDPTAVVDVRLKVHGIDKLRVIDASVIPNPNTGRTMAPVVMVAEKASDIIKEDWEEYHKF